MPKKFARVLRRHREAAGLSQEALAERAGLHRTYISLIERTERSPTLETLQKIAAALKIRLSKLLEEAERSSSKP